MKRMTPPCLAVFLAFLLFAGSGMAAENNAERDFLWILRTDGLQALSVHLPGTEGMLPPVTYCFYFAAQKTGGDTCFSDPEPGTGNRGTYAGVAMLSTGFALNSLVGGADSHGVITAQGGANLLLQAAGTPFYLDRGDEDGVLASFALPMKYAVDQAGRSGMTRAPFMESTNMRWKPSRLRGRRRSGSS